MVRTIGMLTATLLAVAPALVSAQSVVLRGVVEDSAGTPLADVVVTPVGGTGPVSTDSLGRFVVVGLSSGEHRFTLRRPGFKALTTSIPLHAIDTNRVTFEMQTSAVSLEEMRIRSDAVSPKLMEVGFDRRRKLESVPSSQFVTRSDIERRNPVLVSDMMRRMNRRASGPLCMDPLLYVDGGIRPRWAPPPSRPIKTSNGAVIPSIGGQPSRHPVDEIDPKEIEGIEVYTGPAQIPPEFKASGRGFECVVVIWTRSGS